MAILMYDGFEMYGEVGTGQFNMDDNRWSSNTCSPVNASTISPKAPRTGNYCINANNGSSAWEFKNPSLGYSLISTQERWYGFGYFPVLHNANQNYIFSIYDGGFAPAGHGIGTEQMCLKSNPNGTIVVKNGDGTTLGTSVAVLDTSIWQYIEVYVKIHNTEGAVIVRIDGNAVLNLTNVDTQNSPNATHDTFLLISDQVSTWYDDVYATDNGFLGPQKIYPIDPNAVGALAEFDRGGADSGANWSQVEEMGAAGPDDDTTFVYTSTTSEVDLYNVHTVSESLVGTINAIQIHAYAKKTATGLTSLYNQIYVGSTQYSGRLHTLSETYHYHDYIWQANPQTGNQWTLSAINALQIGVKSSN